MTHPARIPGKHLGARPPRVTACSLSAAPLGCVRDQLKLRQPDGGLAVARRAIVAARRQRATRADLRRIRDRAALELAELEEAIQEGTQMALDLGDGVLAAVPGRHGRPDALLASVPRAVLEKRDPRGRVAEAQRVVQVEVLQLIRADNRLTR